MEFTAKQIAEYVQGKVEGDENATIHTFAKIEEGVKGAISFLSNPKYTHYIYNTESSVVLIDKKCNFRSSSKYHIDKSWKCL
jgi:UDP-3-O-[3-hydroxymyristoyl] glucosamine N-acyltransferase